MDYMNRGMLENFNIISSIIPLFHYSKRFLILLSLVFIFLGCESGNQLNKPPEIRYGEDPCDECHMLINESRYVAGYVTNDRQTRRFDDIGCLLLYQKEHDETVAQFWVKDFNTQEWLKADTAFFVRSDSIQTPMGFGIIAFKDKKAVQYIFPTQNQDQILKFSQLLEMTEEFYY